MVRKLIYGILGFFMLSTLAFAQVELDDNADNYIDGAYIVSGAPADNALIRWSEDGAVDKLQPSLVTINDAGSINIPAGQTYNIDGSAHAHTGVYQPVDTDLTALAAINGVQGDIIYHNGTSWVRLGAGTADYYLQTKGAGQNPVWAEVVAGGGGLGDVLSVGDCVDGACLDGSSDGGTYIRIYDGNSHYTAIYAGDSTGNLTFTLPTAAPGANDALVVMATTGAMSTLPATTYQPLDTDLTALAAVSGVQGDVLYHNGSAWVKLAAGVNGQYLQTQGAGANPQWASTAISGDIEAVGDVNSGQAFNGSSGNTLQFEGATANDFEISLTGADASADVTVTIPAETGTIVLSGSAFANDNRIIRSDASSASQKVQQSGWAIDDSDVMTTSSGVIAFGADPADAGPIRLSNATYIYAEAGADDTDIQVIGVDSGDIVQIAASGASGVTITPATTITGALTLGGSILTGNRAFTIGDATTDSITFTTDGTGTAEIVLPNDSIGDAEIDWGTGAGQIDLDDVVDGSTYQRVAATDVDANSHVNLVQDSDGTGAVQFTGPTATRAITVDDAAQTLAARNRENTFTENNTFGNADADTLTIQAIVRGSGRAVTIDDDGTSAPTYATGTNELFVEGDIETAGTVYANAFISTGTGDTYIALANNAGGLAPSGYRIYFETDSTDVLSYSLNGAEKRVANLSDEQTFTAAKTFSAALALNRGATGAGQLLIYEDSDEGSNYIILTSPALAGNYTLTFPTTDGNSGQYLKTDGSGVTSWDTPTASAATDSSTEGVVQFNTSGAIDADASFKYTEASYTLLIGESNGSSLDGKLQLFNEGGTDYTVTIQPGTQSADATITLPGSTSTLATLGLAETFSGNKTFSGTVEMSANTATLTHSGTTSLTVASTSGTVIVESVTFTGDAITGVSSLTVGALAGVNSIDATGAVDMDYGSADVTDHTFVSDGGTVVIDGSVTAAGSFIIGSADLNETDLEKLDGITNGTQAANKAVVADANVNTGVSKVTELHIGASGSEVQVTATAAELNYNDIAALGTGAASKAVVLDGSGNYTAPAGTWDLDGATAVSLPNTTIEDSGTLTFDESADDPNDADVVLSATDGVFKIAAANGANNEDITIDVDQTANTVIINSSTGVTDLYSALPLRAPAKFLSYDAAQTLTAAAHNGAIVMMTVADEVTMWDCTASTIGHFVTLWARDAEKIEVVPATDDQFYLFAGTGIGANDELDIAATAGTKVTLMCTAANEWRVVFETAACTDGGAAD